ncbi:hypothetical protein [Stackebrandtia soli]|uniref:hypothetical protein n=1 Tax=Stackebrandtia soli TaxID=1892856 RepID=UPI0039E8E39A
MRHTRRAITGAVLAGAFAFLGADCGAAGDGDSADPDASPTDPNGVAYPPSGEVAEDLSGTFYSVVETDDSATVYSWSADGDPTEVLELPSVNFITMSPDGRYVTWVQTGGERTHQLMIHDLSSDEEDVIADIELAGHSVYAEPTWSPDGRPMLLVQPDPGGELSWFDVETGDTSR